MKIIDTTNQNDDMIDEEESDDPDEKPGQSQKSA